MQPQIQTKTEYVTAINTVLYDFIGQQKDKARFLSPYYQDLWQEIDRLLRSGGKRLRPRMSVLAYRAFGGKDVDAMMPAAAAQELLHLGMLVHDDIIDRDYVRYGVDNIAGSYNKLYGELVQSSNERLHYANSAAVLGGDLLLSSAYLLAAESTVPAEKVIAVQKLLGQAIFEVIGGELLDTETAFRGANALSAEAVALYKTASYTFTLPMLVGAYLADLPPQDLGYVREFAKNLGIAFQLRDDVIGVFGDESATGKSSTGDIREGKRTYMIEQFNILANDDQKVLFSHYFGHQSITSDEAMIVRDLLVNTGALAATEAAIDDYEAKARAQLAKLTIQEDCVEELEELITVATRRAA
jgi:geranylgeranyl diphosphate synthase, type II